MALTGTVRTALALVAIAAVSTACTGRPSGSTSATPAPSGSASLWPAPSHGTGGPPDWPATAVALPRSLFGPASALRRPVADAPLATNSHAVAALVARDAATRGAGFSWRRWNTTFYAAPPGTPTTNVAFADCDGDGVTPPVFAAAMSDVPIPPEAVPAPDDDGHLSVYDPATDRLWEMWRAARTPTGWQACWGGRIDDTWTSDGGFPDGTGGTASKLSVAGTMVRIDEVAAGRIDHVVGLVVPTVRRGVVSWPATSTDGNSPEPDAVAEGQVLRLPRSVDVGALRLSPLAKIIARAAQDYGFIVIDKSGAVGVIGESGLPSERALGTNPWNDLLRIGQRDPYTLLDGFPWDKLQVVAVDWGKP